MLFRLVAILLQRAMAVTASRGALVGAAAGAVVAADAINFDWLQKEAVKVAPGSDVAALVEAARTAARLLNLEGDEVLWPRRRDGSPIAPNYLVLDINRGRAWYTSKYFSRKSVRAAGRPRLARPRGVARYR